MLVGAALETVIRLGEVPTRVVADASAHSTGLAMAAAGASLRPGLPLPLWAPWSGRARRANP